MRPRLAVTGQGNRSGGLPFQCNRLEGVAGFGGVL